VHDPDGIDREKLEWVMELKNVRRGRIHEYVERYGRATYHAGARPWAIPCQIAMPSAIENEISGDDAKTLVAGGCIAVSEGANMPSTPEAVDVFLAARTAYAPGKAANAGGVATSALEMSQNAAFETWTREEVDRNLDQIMTNIHRIASEAAAEAGLPGNLVVGANVAGFRLVANAMLDQGLV
jgi:glutamate dehydrogenase (NADP+)